MKTKNPLYVVKGKDVQEASSVIDLVIKKFNLEPVIKILNNIFQMLLDQVKTFAMYKAVKQYIDDMVEAMLSLARRFGMA